MNKYSILNKTTKNDLNEYLFLCSKHKKFNVNEARYLATIAIKYKNNILPEDDKLQVRWYKSLENNCPDFSVYDDDFFISNLWSCWVLYSRKYLLALLDRKALGSDKSISEYIKPNTIADIGCGFGYSTAGLKEIFPNASVIGTNIPGGFQFKVASEVGLKRNFKVVTEITSQTDLIFASEYFEHFERPIDHLNDVLKIAKPRALIIANSFGSKAVGHFDVYRHENLTVPNTSIGRIFNSILKEFGYRKIKTKFWNSRPNVWIIG